MTHTTSFGLRLRTLRQQRGLSQAALAGDIFSAGYLSRLESGARQPTERVVAYLADRLGVEPSAFQAGSADNALAHALGIATSTEAEADADHTDADEAVAELIAVVDSRGAEDPMLRWQALWLIAGHHRRRGSLADELRCLEQLSVIADDLSLSMLQCRSRTRLARCLRSSGDVSRALRLATSAHRAARQVDLPRSDMRAVLLTLVAVEAEAGLLPDARAHADELLELVADTPGATRAEALWSAATVRVRQADQLSGRALLQQALQELDSREDPRLWTRLRLAAAAQYLQARPPLTGSARKCLAEAQTIVALIRMPVQQQELLVLQAHLAYAENRLADARGVLDRLDFDQLRLTYRDKTRLRMLDSLLRIAEGEARLGRTRIKELAEDAQRTSHLDLAATLWRALAETLEKVERSGREAAWPAVPDDGGQKGGVRATTCRS
ncbi:helix-turn-helix domain-containing protein [Micromonosporaceae bacterium Da 78-11]